MGILEIPKSPSYCLTDKVKRRLLWNPFPHVFLLSLIALQAPERLRGTCDVITIPTGHDASYVTPLPGGQYQHM